MKLLLALTLVPASLVWSQTSAPARPKITGVAHIALAVHDIEKSRVYYKDFLGYGEPYKLDNPNGSLSLTFIKVNERQYIELFPEKTANTNRLLHISLEVDDAEAMRVYLRSKGVKVPEKVSKGRIKNSNFMVTDPDGHLVEIHPEIGEAADVERSAEPGCQVLAAERPQLLVTNLMVASAMLNALWAVVEHGSVPYSEVYLDVTQCAARPRRWFRLREGEQ